MIEFVLVMVALTIAVVAAVMAADAHVRIGELEQDITRQAAHTQYLAGHVHQLRMKHVADINKVRLSWWDRLEADLEASCESSSG